MWFDEVVFWEGWVYIRGSEVGAFGWGWCIGHWRGFR